MDSDRTNKPQLIPMLVMRETIGGAESGEGDGTAQSGPSRGGGEEVSAPLVLFPARESLSA
jgi:hypothetical protein